MLQKYSFCDFAESDHKHRIKGGSSEEEVITFLHRVKKLGREGQSLVECLSHDVSFIDMQQKEQNNTQSLMNLFFEGIYFDLMDV